MGAGQRDGRPPLHGANLGLIDCFESDCGESGYPNVSISPDNIMVKLKANAEQNATPM